MEERENEMKTVETHEQDEDEEFYSADEFFGEDSQMSKLKSSLDQKRSHLELSLVSSSENQIDQRTAEEHGKLEHFTPLQPPLKQEKEEEKDEEAEFIVKNLDTGQVFSSKCIDEYIPKGIDPKSLDPISYNIMHRTPLSNLEYKKHTQEQQMTFSGEKETKKKLFAKVLKLRSGKTKTEKKRLFAQILRQQINKHTGSIWIMKFNYDGCFLATGGSDTVINIWKTSQSVKHSLFFEMEPYRSLQGHSGDILNLSWSLSRSNILLSASMDNTVKLWNLNSKEGKTICEYSFSHDDVVTGVAFHPKVCIGLD